MHRANALVLVVLVVGAGCAGIGAGPAADATATTSGVEPTDRNPTGGDDSSGAAASSEVTGENGEVPGYAVTVVSVTDGDTVTIRFRNGSRETVRLLGVDTPEVHVENTPSEFAGVPTTAAGRRCLRRWGERASAFARDRLAGRRVTFRFDARAAHRGYYGRLLGYLVVDGTQFNYRLIEEGYARLYDGPFTARARYAAAERAARTNGTGLWRCTTVEGDTSDEGTGSTGLSIATIHADAAGNDHENANGEYVVLENTGDATLRLGGWVVRDAAGHTYTFPRGATLAPGARLTLHTGLGEDGEGHYYWGSDGAVWNNGGDTVTVRDAAGTLVARRSYP